MGKVLSSLQKQATDRASAMNALARFTLSESFRESLPRLDENYVFMSDTEFDDRFGEYVQEEREMKAEFPDFRYFWVNRRSEDAVKFAGIVQDFMKRNKALVSDLQSFADHWGIPFDPEMAVQSALMADLAYDKWNNSWC